MHEFDLRVFRFGAFDGRLVVGLLEPIVVLGEREEARIGGVVPRGQQFTFLTDVERAGGDLVPILVSIEFSGA